MTNEPIEAEPEVAPARKLTLLEEAENQILNPLTGEMMEADDVDSLAECYDAAERLRNEMDATMKAIRIAIGKRAQGEGKTLRVRGERHRIKVVLPDPNWNQAALKRAWNEWPHLAQQYLRIARIEPQMREVKKLRNETGPGTFEAFKALVLSAEEPSAAPPRIEVETDTERELGEQEWRVAQALAASLKKGGA